ncbi:TOMM system kinase/cyclase fusion protein (plasmid) [Sorangium sp. So ce119]|uniref:TOMM system kinase/cyclase fusion protein n=1 Tax=Sorangium sp. So ce119 TaxID=3133279 RepID=UPI003F5D7BDD
MDSRQKIGAVLGDRYEILAELGEGGFGTVYKARQLATGQLVAIKVLQLGSSGAAQAREKRIARFQREMQLCAQLHHPNIVRLIDSGQADEAVVYSVFEFVPGKDLAQVLAEEGPLDPREARHFMLQILDALGCAHAQGVIHRDLKPANLMIIPTGARRNVLVLDFGIGALTEEATRDEKTRITLTNESVGTPAYAAPEQLRGQPPTPRSDLYAWGLVFLECLTGKRVIAGDTAADVIFNQLSTDPVAIPATILDHPLGNILRRATAKDAAARNVTTEGLLRELEECDVSGLRPRSAPARLQPAAPNMRTETVELAGQGSSGGLSRRLVEGERRQITAVCCTLTATSTGRGAADMEELDQLLGLQQEACTMIARRFNGHVAGVLGDRVLFYFGYPTAREDAARHAAEAAREMAADLLRRRKALETERKVRIDFRIGIHTGLVIARELRDQTIAGLGYVVGTTPKLAARLSAAAEPGSILVSGETQRLLRKHFALEADGTRSLEGFDAPAAVFLLREGSASGGLRDVPLVGRARELETLMERWGRGRSGAGQAVLITGEPGIGKSRLARELEEKIGGEAHSWLESRCTPDGANSAFYPIVDLLDRLMDPRREVKEDRAAKLEALLSLHGFDLTEAMPLFAPLLSIPLPNKWVALDVSSQKQRELTRNAVLSLLFEMAEKEPVALFIEDLHWADPSTLELLGQLVGEVGSAHVLALFTARPEFVPPWSPTAMLQIQLGRFDRPQVEQMATTVTGDHALPAEVLDAIACRTDGVPLFVEELVLAMIEAGALVEEDGRYTLAKPLSDVAIPSTLRDLLVSRLDRLGRAKETAQVAAAIGREFSFELLRAVSPRSEAEAQEDLDKLVVAELVHRKRRLRSAAYLFKHALVQDAAYESMLKRSRQQVHARIAKALEEKLPEVVSERPDLLAHHHAEADQKQEAIGYAQKAATGALMRSAYEEAIRHARHALAWVDAIENPLERASTELSVNGLLTMGLMARQGYASGEVEAALARSSALIETLGDCPQVFATRVALFMFHHLRSHRVEACALAQRMLAVAQREQDVSQELVTLVLLSNALLMEGRFVQARSLCERAISLYEPEAHRGRAMMLGIDLKVYAGAALSILLCYLGYPEQAFCQARSVIEWARELNHKDSLMNALIASVVVHFENRERDQVAILVDSITEIATRYGLAMYQNLAAIFRSWVDRDADAASRHFAALQASGQNNGTSLITVLVADIELDAGRHEVAFARLDACMTMVLGNSESYYDAELLRQKGTCLLARDASSEVAAECFREAIMIAQRQSAKTFELHASVALAKLLRSRGAVDEAKALVSSILDWFPEDFSTPPLREARSLLD